jgi:prepilin-type N-terminal cleavage/methylation domain-containing protein
LSLGEISLILVMVRRCRILYGLGSGVFLGYLPLKLRRRGERESVKRGAGFTIIEIMVVLVIVGITTTVVSGVFYNYLDRSTAKRAAEVFRQDLTVARNAASRSRQPVELVFDEENLGYVIRVEAGDTIVNRVFDRDAEIILDFLDLDLTGDMVAFNDRGVADLSGAKDPLGVAFFRAGDDTYTVSFNSMGSSRLDIFVAK